MDEFRYTDPGALDLMEKGDDAEELIIKRQISRNKNKGRKQRFRNKQLKNMKRKKIISYAPFYSSAGQITDKGYIKFHKNSNRAQFIKKRTSHQLRMLNRCIDDEDPADVKRRGKGITDYEWEMF